MSQTLLFIEKHQLSLEELENIATERPKAMQNIKNKIVAIVAIVAIDEKMQNISKVQRHIGTYGETKEAYAWVQKI